MMRAGPWILLLFLFLPAMPLGCDATIAHDDVVPTDDKKINAGNFIQKTWVPVDFYDKYHDKHVKEDVLEAYKEEFGKKPVKEEDVCILCHHGKDIEEDPSSCGDCHELPLDDKDKLNTPGFKKAIHSNCMKCHEDYFEGGLKSCTKCHIAKKKEAKDGN